MEQLSLSLEKEFNFAIQEELYCFFLSIDVIFWYYGVLFILVMYFTNGTDSKNLTIKNKKKRKKNKNKNSYNTSKHIEFILRNGKKRNRFSGKFS